MITLNVTPLQYDIIKAAVAQYTNNLMQVIEPTTTVTISSATASVTAEVPVRPWDKPEAPYGLKKDGTPRARPGRKSARKGRA